jgi:SAM-dependent methyltransferase
MRAASTRALAPCMICETYEIEILANKSRTGEPLLTVLCVGCGLAHVEPLPSEADLAAFYQQEYRQQYKNSSEPKAYHVLRNGRLAKQRLQLLSDWWKVGDRLLDVGCGGGEFVYLSAKAGLQVSGWEADGTYAAYVRRELAADVYHGQWCDGPTKQNLDLITLFHVLEHLADPLQRLRTLRPMLRPQGRLIIEVPNLETEHQRFIHRFHKAHLFHFSAPTLKAFGERAGFRVLWQGTTERDSNLLAVFERTDVELVARKLQDNFQRIQQREQHRKETAYWFSPNTWARAWHRWKRQAEERATAKSFARPRDILDSLA